MCKKQISVEAFDLFCGIGGLTHGLQQSGIPVRGGLDIDKSCQYTYEINNNAKFFLSDIKDWNYGDIAKTFQNSRYKILAGCAPCQPFSKHTLKNRARRDDVRWGLLDDFLRLVREGRPDVVSMENVPQLRNTDVYAKFYEGLQNLQYNVCAQVINCCNYGVPQVRRRLLLLASLHGNITLSHLPTIPLKTVRDTIKYLPTLQSGETSQQDILHQSARLSDINMKRIQHSKPGGTWRDWPKDLLPQCYTKESGKTYTSVYGRMQWDKPSPTITTQFYIYGTGRFGHPDQDRALSMREGALLQTFPADYRFCTQTSLKNTGKHIGNAVPPQIGEVIGESIIKHLEDIDGR